jgi:hypothetical protein
MAVLPTPEALLFMAFAPTAVLFAEAEALPAKAYSEFEPTAVLLLPFALAFSELLPTAVFAFPDTLLASA